MADGDQKEQQKKEQADLLFELFKEHTGALVENTKALKTLILQVAGQDGTGPDNDGAIPGLLDRLEDLEETNESLQEAVDALDGRLIGLNMKLSGVEFVMDRLVEVAQGNLESTPPAPPRTPTWEDAARAKRDYDKKVEEEMIAAADAAEKAEAAEEAHEPAVPATASASSVPLMLANTKKVAPPVMRSLPPLPVAPAQPH